MYTGPVMMKAYSRLESARAMVRLSCLIQIDALAQKSSKVIRESASVYTVSKTPGRSCFGFVVPQNHPKYFSNLANCAAP